jgi:hypothetical protein
MGQESGIRRHFATTPVLPSEKAGSLRRGVDRDEGLLRERHVVEPRLILSKVKLVRS